MREVVQEITARAKVLQTAMPQKLPLSENNEAVEEAASQAVQRVYEEIAIDVTLSAADIRNVKRILSDDRFEPERDAVLVVKVRRK